MGRHEEASVAARSALGECSKNVVGEEKQKALVLCYFNIAVEEDYLKNHEVALLNYEKSYETSRDNLGEEDPLT
jgi:hypothetical protein